MEAAVLRYPPYRIETERLVIRCWNPGDAEQLKATIDQNLHHLRRWMPWALNEPTPIDQKVELLRAFRSMFDASTDFVYGVFAKDDHTVLGGSGFHTRRGPAAFEIGYWIDRRHTRMGLATELVRALVPAAFMVHGIDLIEIRCEAGNEASAAIPRKLGFTHEATLRRRGTDFPGEFRDQMVFSLFRADALAALAGSFPRPVMFDAAGHRIEGE